MRPKQFLEKIDSEKILAAIRAAENGSHADVVVLISQKQIPNALHEAESSFAKLRLKKSVHQNSLLILVAPRSQTFAVVGGCALHAKVGQEWWNRLSELLGRHFKEQQFTEGLLAALESAGQALQLHFPATSPPDRSGEQDLIQE